MDGPAPAAPTAGPAACLVDFTVTTATTGRDYRPRNVGAIWVADAAGKFVKTLAVWANRRINHVLEWTRVTREAGDARNTVDAVTGPTAGNHVAHKVTWNCTNTDKGLVNQGMYQICMEMTESSSRVGGTPTEHTCVGFAHAGKPLEVMPPNVRYFESRRLVYTPK
jgi:hypothetical protein